MRGEEVVGGAYGKGDKERMVPKNAKPKKRLRVTSRRGMVFRPRAEDPNRLFLDSKGGRSSDNTVRRTPYEHVRSRAT